MRPFLRQLMRALGKILMKALYFITVVFLMGCSSEAERRDVIVKSGYLNNEFSTQVPSVYINNLPHQKNVSEYIAMNTSVLLTPEATKKLDNIINNCSNCLSADRLVQPIRITHVPIGTKFKVIGEYLYFRNIFLLADSKIHFLLLKDDKSNIIEISKLSFEGFFIPHNRGYSDNQEIKRILKDLKSFDNGGNLVITYCPYLDIVKNQNILKFINDFSLEDDVKMSKDYSFCEGGSKLLFSSPESYLTSRYYFQGWSLYGRWHSLLNK